MLLLAIIVGPSWTLAPNVSSRVTRRRVIKRLVTGTALIVPSMSSALDFVDERSGELYSPSRSMVTNSLGSAKALGLDPKSKTAPQISSSSIR